MRKAGWFLKIIIFISLWIIGGKMFASFGGSMGTTSGFLFVGQTFLGSRLMTDANSLIYTILSFIITAVFYYLISEAITFGLSLLFGRRK